MRAWAATMLSIAAAHAVAAPPAVTLQPFVSGLGSPTEITHAGDASGRLFVTEQGGRIRVIRNGALLAQPFLDLSRGAGGPVRAGGESGLLGLAFHPQYATNRQFYVYYTRDLAGDPAGSELVVARHRRSLANPDAAESGAGTIVIVVPHPQQGNHNGGKIAFGPDGYLYIGTGDGGGGGDPFDNAQDLGSLLGKILRIDVDAGAPYAIPASNPFVGNFAARPEVWAYGLRNPWKFTFDRATGDLFIGDVGQNAWEEVDFEPAASGGGRNYGWRVFEGMHCFNPPTACSLANHTPPVIEYPHTSAGGFSVTGGYRYRGSALPALGGYYIYGDYVSGRIWAASPGEAWAPTQIATLPNLSTFGEDESGELYAANLVDGTIVRVTPPATVLPRLANISSRARVGTGEDVIIGGFVIGGSAAKQVAIRARGPSLAASGVASPLQDPVLQLFAGQAPIAANDDWQAAPNSDVVAFSGFAPIDARESAILASLDPGAYTAVVFGKSGGTGVGIVEVFEVDRPDLPLLNISTRGQVLTGEDVMIGGFVIQGSAPQSVVVRARGPSLTPFGVANALANPVLQLVRSSDQATIATNDDWGAAANAAQVAASGFAPSDSLESAILISLDPGAYTVIVTGAGGGTGVGIVEVFAQ